MTALFTFKTLSPLPLLPHLPNPSPNPNPAPPPPPPRTTSSSHQRRRTLFVRCSMEVERGVAFDTGDSFFRRESAAGRDLGVLAAAVHRHRRPSSSGLRVLDAMCGCGVRSLRYLSHGIADFVWANDAFEGNNSLILANLSGEPRFDASGERRWVVTHLDANRVLAECYLRRNFFDLVDVDSFGSDSVFLRSAIAAAKIGGLLYVTSTDGRSSGGHRPTCSLASYGAYVRPMPYSNEVGLRMLIGGVLREAAALGFHISPLFSYYSYHGPIFRVMLQVDYGKDHDVSRYGFISYCSICGHSQTYSWDELGQVSCPCRNGEVSSSVSVSGPLWIGPLHDPAFVAEMLQLAEEWGWAHTDRKDVDLEKLLNRMIDESDPRLPPGYIKIDEIASRAKLNSPAISIIIDTLRKEGYAACRSHIESNAIKTNCPMATCIQIALRYGHWR